AAARWVYPWAGVDVTEHWFFQDRADYHTLPGLRRAGALLLEAVGLGIERVQHLDLYSCFPIAPRLSAAMLGLAPDDPRPLTVTGALPWFGGPGSNYTTHAVATLAERLRAERAGRRAHHRDRGASLALGQRAVEVDQHLEVRISRDRERLVAPVGGRRRDQALEPEHGAHLVVGDGGIEGVERACQHPVNL